MEKLYKFRADCRRLGTVHGTFVADDIDVKNIIGKTIYFGEILGKHSEVIIDLEENHFHVLTDDQDFIEKFKYLVGSSGYNPFDYEEDQDFIENIEKFDVSDEEDK